MTLSERRDRVVAKAFAAVKKNPKILAEVLAQVYDQAVTDMDAFVTHHQMVDGQPFKFLRVPVEPHDPKPGR